MNNRSEFLFTPTYKMKEWLAVIDEAVIRCGDVYVMSDTETTSNQLFEVKGDVQYRHRMLEYAFLFYVFDTDAGKLVPLKDSNNEPIFFHELCNFFAETEAFRKKVVSVGSIPNGSIEVHGITEDYLLGEERSPKNRPKLRKMALPFADTIGVALRMFQTESVFERESPIKCVFHNAFFDTGYFNSELRSHNMAILESYMFILDTFQESKRILPGLDSYSLDSLYKIACKHFNDEPIKRPFHDARTDAEMLALVMSLLLAKR